MFTAEINKSQNHAFIRILCFINHWLVKNTKQENLQCKTQQAYLPPELERLGLYL